MMSNHRRKTGPRKQGSQRESREMVAGEDLEQQVTTDFFNRKDSAM